MSKGDHPPGKRRRVTLAALRDPHANRAELARRFEIPRSYIYKLIDDARRDPKGARAEAKAEYAFRCEVEEILEEGG